MVLRTLALAAAGVGIDVDTATCEIINDFFGYLVQGILALIAFLTLVYKWYLAKGVRSWRDFIRDASKQGVGALAAHFMNMALSEVLRDYGNTCKWYFVNYMVDNIFGIILNYILLRLVEAIAKTRTDVLDSGVYGEEGPLFNKIWFYQSAIWVLVVCAVKTFIFFVIVVPFKIPLYDSGHFLLYPLDRYPRIQLLFVMVIVPVVLNVLQFWIQDSYLMAKPKEVLIDEDYHGEVGSDGHTASADDDDDVAKPFVAKDSGGSTSPTSRSAHTSSTTAEGPAFTTVINISSSGSTSSSTVARTSTT